jgi:hypothetical protein
MALAGDPERVASARGLRVPLATSTHFFIARLEPRDLALLRAAGADAVRPHAIRYLRRSAAERPPHHRNQFVPPMLR